MRTAVSFDRLGNLLGAAIAVVVNQHLRDTVHHGQRRVIRVQRELHAGFFRHRKNGLHQVRVGVPDFLRRILAVELLLLDLVAKIIDAELPGAVTARRLDDVGRIGVRGVEVVAGNRDAKRAQIPKEELIGLDVLIAARLAELQVQLAVGVVDAREDLDPMTFVALLRLRHVVKVGVALKIHARPAQSDLPQEEQVVFGDVGPEPPAEFDVRGIVLVDDRPRRQ